MYWVFRPESERYFMTLKQGFGVQHPTGSYILAACAGAMLFTSYWWLLGKALPVKAQTNHQQQGEPKKPDVQQSSQGANSPNIIGDNNTVYIGDPKVSARLDEITRLLKAQGDRIVPKTLLAKYPLGYVIFYVDYSDSVFPYTTQALDRWEFNWSVVKLMQNIPGKFRIVLPDMKSKGSSTWLMTGNILRIPATVGPFPRDIFSDHVIVMKGEILAIGEKGTVFLIGFTRADSH
jgi:hypothetical protein